MARKIRKGARVVAAVRIEADPEHGVGEVPAGTEGTVTYRPHGYQRFGYVQVSWDNGCRFYTTRWRAL